MLSNVLKNVLTFSTPFALALMSPTAYSETKAPGLEKLSLVIAQSEQKYSDIVKGSEKHIRWYQNNAKRTALSLVYIHGFSASRQELSPVTERLADQLGANVFYTRLAGHGRSDDAMAQATTDAWKKDIEDAYNIGRIIGRDVIIISTSTGGTLATWLLAQPDTDQPLANIMVSPNFAIQNNSAWLLKSSWGMSLAKWIKGDYQSFTPISPAHAKYWTERYPLEAVQPMLELLDEVDELDKSPIATQQLIVYSPDDKVIDVTKITQVSKQFTNSTTQLIPFSHSKDPYQHVLAGIACSPESTDHMIELLANYINTLQ